MNLLSTRTRRAGALLLTAAFLLAQLVGFAHVATERHEVCEEHGEFVHVDVSPAAEEDHEHDGPAAVPAGVQEDHEHCGLVLVYRSSARPHLAAGLNVHLVSARARGLVSETREIERSVPPLAQAPKQSPPA